MMNQKNDEIQDDEIRVISSQNYNSDLLPKPKPPRKPSRKSLWLALIGLLIVAVCVGWKIIDSNSAPAEETPAVETVSASLTDSIVPKKNPLRAQPFTTATDTVVNGTALTILTPHNASPILTIGPDAISDTSAVLIAQAADIRADNGMIVGTFVIDGKLIGHGEKKAGFCAIIDGKITIGVAETTPLFEQAIDSRGYFFRQYPLVVAGQIVENKPKGRALRKALADLNGHPVVLVSRERLTFHDFSQALCDIGVTNAIYLVGSSAFTLYRNESGAVINSDVTNIEANPNVNFFVWK